MTSQTQPDAKAPGAVDARDVAGFLRANPAFLDQHPDLLRALTIPHQSGDAVSLLERQVAVLRDDNARLKKQLDEWVRLARANETLNHKIHELVLTLMHAVGPQAIFASLDRALREQFGADRVQSLLFAEPAFVDSGDGAHFAGSGSPRREPFAAQLGAATTVCGALTPAAREALFSAEEGAASAVVMPLIGKGWDGVLVIASNDASRYQADMGTEFLSFLKEIVTLVLDPWVKRPRSD